MGTMGLPVLLGVLREDRDDLELLRGAAEVLLAVLAPPEGGPPLPPPLPGQEVRANNNSSSWSSVCSIM
jgi:hypothetical protein